MMGYDIYSEFDIQKHKDTYKHYLEVIIDSDGKIMYAVPSHQEKAIRLACEKTGKSRDEIIKSCPPEYYFDYMNWLLMQTDSIAVWEKYYEAPSINLKQIVALRKLKMHGLYLGSIPRFPCTDCF